MFVRGVGEAAASGGERWRKLFLTKHTQTHLKQKNHLNSDSISKDLYKALKCFLIEFWDLVQYEVASRNHTLLHHLETLPGYGEPRCIVLPQGGRVCQVHAIQGDLFIDGGTRAASGVLPMLTQSGVAGGDDVFVVNFGLWHGETVQEAYSEHLHKLGRWHNATKADFPNLLWLETPKQHFDSVDGDYKVAWIGQRRGPWTCQPVDGVGVALAPAAAPLASAIQRASSSSSISACVSEV